MVVQLYLINCFVVSAMSDPAIEFSLATTSSTLVDSVPDDYFDPFLPSLDVSVEEQSLQQSMDVNKECQLKLFFAIYFILYFYVPQFIRLREL